MAMERMLAGVATRRHARTPSRSAKRSAALRNRRVSRRFRAGRRQTETALAELMARDLSELDITVLMLDGE